jgi:predicted aspartyl protease
MDPTGRDITAHNEGAMETETMGKVLVTAKLENIYDLYDVNRGQLTDDKVRRVEVMDALVDTGASTLLLPKRLIAQLGLHRYRQRQSRGLGGPLAMPMYGVVRLTIQGRDCHLDVGEIDDEFPVLVGQIPLEMLDWVIDTKHQRLIGNPEHGGEQMIDVF